MPATKNLKSTLLRATAATALIAPALLVSDGAHAATGQINTSSLVTTGTTCRARIGFDITGTSTSAGFTDFYAATIESTGSGVESRTNLSVPVGTTQTIPNFQIDFSNGQRELRTFVLRETNAQGGAFTGTIDQVSFTRAEMIAAGGECARSAPNSAPTAVVGTPTGVTSGVPVTMSGLASSDPDGDALTYQWTQVSGPTVNLTNTTLPTLSFNAPSVTAQTLLTFELQVTDAAGERSLATGSFNVAPDNFAPVVDAGADQTVSGAANVQLAGTASDQDNDPLTYQWVQIGGTGVTLSDATVLNPTFTAPPRGVNDQTLVFELAANDGTVSATDTVEVLVRGNQAPTANIAPVQNISGGQTVTLDGTGSTDPEGDALVYRWSQISGPPVTINNPNSATATFVPPQNGSTTQAYLFELSVTDTFDASDTTSIVIEQGANVGPTADAGVDQDVGGGDQVTLDASGSTDPEGDQLFYSWAQVSGAPVTLSDPTIANPTFTAPPRASVDQTIEFEVTVRDRQGTGQVDPQQLDTVTITVLANRPPVADAGADQGPIDSGQTVTLDGTGSADPDGDTLIYTWTQISGTTVTLSDPNAAQPTFTAPLVAGNEDLEFNLTVTDVTGSVRTLPQQSDTVVIGIQAIGSITLIQEVAGRDTQFAFTSDLAALNANVTTSGGAGQIVASNVAAGSYTVTAPDLSAQGYVVTGIVCNDTDSVVDLNASSVAIELAPDEDLVCTFSTANAREAASAAINNFLTGRNALILSHQPDLQRRLDRLSNPLADKSGSVTAYGVPVPGSNHVPINANISRSSAQVSTSLTMALGSGSGDGRALDIWGEAYFSDATIGQQEGSFSIFYLGADVKVSNGLLLGALVQKDEFGNDGPLQAGEAEGEGWMAGPYLTAQLAPQLFAEARAAWGQSDNRVSPLAGQIDDFDTSRSYYSGSLIGQFDLGDATRIRPELTVRYLSENQKEYTDVNGISIPSQTVAQGDVSFRPRLSHLVKMESGWAIRPFAEVEGIYTFGAGPDSALSTVLPEGFVPVIGDFRGRVEGGLDVMSSGSFRATLSGFHDGIGADGYSATGVHAGVSFGF